MASTGPFLERCAARLKFFDRARVGRVGCGVALAGMACALAVIAAGAWDVRGSWGAGFRFTVVCGLAAVLLSFLVLAALEQVRERTVWRDVTRFLDESGMELETLRQAAQARAASLPGGARLAELLKNPPGGGRPAR
jgi:hypothetical protein